jgi:hypothetical protein
MKRLLALGWIAAGYLAAQGCAHAPAVEAPAAIETGEVRPAPGQSALVVYRTVGGKSGASLSVLVDGAPVGELAREKFAVIDLAPGKHVVSAHSAYGETGLLVETEVGVVHFVQLEGSAQPKLTSRDPEVARVEIATDCTFGFRGATGGATAQAPGNHRT